MVYKQGKEKSPNMGLKGLSSIEYLFITGIGLAALALIIVIGMNMGNDSIRLAQAKDSVEKLAKSADYVHSLGADSREAVDIYLPRGMRNLSVRDDRVWMRVALSSGDTDVYAKSSARKLIGSLPQLAGAQKVTITSLLDGSVLFGDSYLLCSPSRISESIFLGSGQKSAALNVTNAAPYEIGGIAINLTGSVLGIVLSPPASMPNLSEGESAVEDIVFESEPAGIYSGLLEVAGSNGSRCLSEVFVNVFNQSEDPLPPGGNVTTPMVFLDLSEACQPLNISVTAIDTYSQITGCRYQIDYNSWVPMDVGAGWSPVNASALAALANRTEPYVVDAECTNYIGNTGGAMPQYICCGCSIVPNGTEADDEGPNVTVDSITYGCVAPLEMRVVADDTAAGGNAIMGCNYSIDGGNWTQMSPADGTWNDSQWEIALATGGVFEFNTSHNITFNCTDSRGNSGIAAAYKACIPDTWGPEVTVLPPGPLSNASANITSEDRVEVFAICNDTSSGESYIISAEVRFGNESEWIAMSPFGEMGFNISMTAVARYITPTPLPPGDYIAEVRCTDSANNTGLGSHLFSVSNTLDLQGPIITDFEHVPSFVVTISDIVMQVNATDNSTGGSNITGCVWKMDATGGTGCSPSVPWNSGNITLAQGEFNNSTEVSLEIGIGRLKTCTYLVQAYCSDSKGNNGSIATDTFKVAEGDIMLVMDRSGSMNGEIGTSFSDSTEAGTNSTSYETVKTLPVNSSASTADLNVEVMTSGPGCGAEYRVMKGAVQVASGSSGADTWELIEHNSTSVGTGRFDLRLEMRTKITAEGSSKRGGTFASANFTPGDIAWSNPSNAQTADNQYAVAILGNSNVSEYLAAGNFGFGIPEGAVIKGIVATVERKASQSNEISDNKVYLVKNGSIAGNNKAVAAEWGSAEMVRTYGGEADLWGAAWTAEEINSAATGIVFSTKHDSGGGPDNASVDSINLTVYYAMPAACTAHNREFSFVQASGGPSKMEAAKAASNSFVDMVDASAKVGLVSYSSSATTDKHLAFMDAGGKSSLKGAIDSLAASGMTCIWCGLNNSVTETISARSRYPNATRMVILMTDGMNNCIWQSGSIACSESYQDDDQDEMVDVAVRARDNFITVYTIGFGNAEDINPVELTNMALLTGGKYYYAPDAETLLHIYQNIGE
ncbi:MAG: VWA domain-containing protein [Candidatus Micrarchaeia archaeon]